MSEKAHFQTSFEQLKKIASEFKSAENMSLDEIESKFKIAKEAYIVCKGRITEIKDLIAQSEES